MANSKKAGLGDCYEANGKHIMDNCVFDSKCGLILCHGEVMGQGPLEGVQFGHAWVLDGNTVIDVSNGRFVRMPKKLYYAMGAIDQIDNVHYYNWPQAQRAILKYEHWGPWDLKTSTGL